MLIVVGLTIVLILKIKPCARMIHQTESRLFHVMIIIRDQNHTMDYKQIINKLIQSIMKHNCKVVLPNLLPPA